MKERCQSMGESVILDDTDISDTAKLATTLNLNSATLSLTARNFASVDAPKLNVIFDRSDIR